jgi:predicted amino acid-binding ACT domain protein
MEPINDVGMWFSVLVQSLSAFEINVTPISQTEFGKFFHMVL